MRYLINSKNSLLFRIAILYALLTIYNIVVWGATLYLSQFSAKFLALAILAYGFGLRHAVDADHIAAIDNVTRKFIQQGEKPVTVGLYFSLGHSSVVFILSFLTALGTIYVRDYIPSFQHIGEIIGTSVSSLFLIIIAIINLIIFIDIVKVIYKYKQENMNRNIYISNSGGLLQKLFKPIFKFISKSYHMYIVGFLFGLGFDTATEIALLGISAAQAAQGEGIWMIMLFPALFMGGMTLIDATDGVLMLGLYGWAFVRPEKKLFYNMGVTLFSFMIAFFIGGVEALAMLSEKFNLNSKFFTYITSLNNNFGNLGYYLIGIFISSWIIASIFYKISEFRVPRYNDGS